MDSFDDIFAADTPGLHLDTFSEELTIKPMDLELKELHNTSGLLQTPPSQVYISPAALPPPIPPTALALAPTPATATPEMAGNFSCTDICQLTDAEIAARKAKAEKKKEAKEAKREKMQSSFVSSLAIE